MGLMKRVHWDNVVQLYPPKAVEGDAAWWWIHVHHEWWEAKGTKLDWQPIATYEVRDPAMALATPMMLRCDDRWVYGSKIGGGWCRFTEGGSWPIDGFEPEEWADVDLDAAILLDQE